MVKRREEHHVVICMMPYVTDVARDGFHRTMMHVAVAFLMNAHPFPTILLVVKFEGGTFCQSEVGICGQPAELSQCALLISSKESNVFDPKLNRLFRVVSVLFDRVLSDA